MTKTVIIALENLQTLMQQDSVMGWKELALGAQQHFA